MKTLYFDLLGGISGDMTVASLLDLGVDFNGLKRELAKIRLKGYALKKTRVQRGHMMAAKFDVVIQENKNYSYLQIIRMIKASSLSQKTKDGILKVYRVLLEAETRVHGHAHQNIRFQQLGDIDSIVDIASVCIGLEKLGVGEIYYSVIPLNNNIAPATFELLCDKEITFRGLGYENVTPTGMAILTALGKQINPATKLTFQAGRCGYGAGSLDPVENSNVLRAVLLKVPESAWETDQVQVLQANIDDMNPLAFEYIFERLFEAGALDVFIQNVYMKKTRPGFLLTVLSNEENLGKITDLLLKETSTIGVRFYAASRLKLSRRMERMDYKGYKVGIKLLSLPDGGFKTTPEYEDCHLIAQKTKIPILKIYQEIKQKAELKWRSQA